MADPLFPGRGTQERDQEVDFGSSRSAVAVRLVCRWVRIRLESLMYVVVPPGEEHASSSGPCVAATNPPNSRRRLRRRLRRRSRRRWLAWCRIATKNRGADHEATTTRGRSTQWCHSGSAGAARVSVPMHLSLSRLRPDSSIRQESLMYYSGKLLTNLATARAASMISSAVPGLMTLWTKRPSLL